MKYTPTLVFILGLFILSFTNSFGQNDFINNVKDAIKAGSSKECAQYFNESLDVTIDGEMKSYSRTQAEYVLRDFFKEHPPKGFVVVHEGSSKGGLPYAIGQYDSEGDTYRVWMRIKSINSKYVIHEISFIKE